MILKIRQAGEIVLRRPARELTRDEIVSETTQRLIGAMRETMRDAPGVGLAAPQVGEPLRIAVLEDRQEYIDRIPTGQLAERGRKAVPFQVLINPILTSEAGKEMHFFEGCLSVAGFTAVVPRALAVRVDYLNERAEPVTIRAGGWYARILQHEIDHLLGALYIDRMQSQTFMTLDNYNRYWKEKSVADYLRAAGGGA